MKTYKVNKNVNKEPFIFGLKVPLFFVFIGIVLLVIFSFVSSISWTKLYVSILVITISYSILKRMNKGSILDRITKEKFPDTIINDNYK